MQKTLFTAALTALFILGTQNTDAQTTRTQWNGLDSIIICQPVHTSQCRTLYILPIDDSKADYFKHDDERTLQKVIASRAAFGPIIRNTIMKAYKNLDVKLVDTEPTDVGADEMVMKIIFTEYNLGSKSLRATVGGGQAGLTLHASITGAGDAELVKLIHRHKSLWTDPNNYEKIIDRINQRFADDFVKMFKALEKE